MRMPTIFRAFSKEQPDSHPLNIATCPEADRQGGRPGKIGSIRNANYEGLNPGGKRIGIQLENEFEGPAEHLIRLRDLTREVGLDVPLYYRTGWPSLTTEMPFGEMLPLYGCYAEGMWDRNIEMMPHGYWEGFTFKSDRIDATIATDHLGIREEKDETNTPRYPYLTCEQGGGMLQSYHRRVHVFPSDVACQAMIKLGCGIRCPDSGIAEITKAEFLPVREEVLTIQQFNGRAPHPVEVDRVGLPGTKRRVNAGA